MATSKKIASLAGKELRKKSTSKNEKRLAGSALSDTPRKPKVDSKEKKASSKPKKKS